MFIFFNETIQLNQLLLILMKTTYINHNQQIQRQVITIIIYIPVRIINRKTFSCSKMLELQNLKE